MQSVIYFNNTSHTHGHKLRTEYLITDADGSAQGIMYKLICNTHTFVKWLDKKHVKHKSTMNTISFLMQHI